MRIGDLAKINAGYQFRGKIETDPEGDVRVIQIKDIPDRRRLVPDSLDRVAFDKPYGNYVVERSDVLFLSRGQNQFAVAVEADLRATIAVGFFYILRTATERVRPGYLAWYLNQEPMQTQLKQLAKGTHMPFVSMSEFRELDIPVPALVVQDRILELDALAEREQTLVRTVMEKRSQLVQTISLQAATRQGRGREPRKTDL